MSHLLKKKSGFQTCKKKSGFQLTHWHLFQARVLELCECLMTSRPRARSCEDSELELQKNASRRVRVADSKSAKTACSGGLAKGCQSARRGAFHFKFFCRGRVQDRRTCRKGFTRHPYRHAGSGAAVAEVPCRGRPIRAAGPVAPR